MSEDGCQGSPSQRTSTESEEPARRVMGLPDAQEFLTSQDQATQEPPPSQSVDLFAESQMSLGPPPSQSLDLFAESQKDMFAESQKGQEPPPSQSSVDLFAESQRSPARKGSEQVKSLN